MFAMAQRSIYLSDDDERFWAEAMKIAETRKTSMSKVIATCLRDFVRDHSTAQKLGMGLPIGAKIPASMKSPEAVAREELADSVRALVLERLESAAEVEAAP
jgi:hypothetical protein